MIKCPHCGASYYSTGPSMRTAVYYPPIWKDGVNTNPDMNVTTTEAHCYECNYDFVIKEQGGKEWVEEGKYNPPKKPLNVDITASACETITEYVPMDTSAKLSIAVIDKNGNYLREKTKEEKDIEEIRNELAEIKEQISEMHEIVFTMFRSGKL